MSARKVGAVGECPTWFVPMGISRNFCFCYRPTRTCSSAQRRAQFRVLARSSLKAGIRGGELSGRISCWATCGFGFLHGGCGYRIRSQSGRNEPPRPLSAAGVRSGCPLIKQTDLQMSPATFGCGRVYRTNHKPARSLHEAMGQRSNARLARMRRSERHAT
jgi:hypothetical protein